mmetsp:Transcript_33440/g.88048  ORF Transcript_33440/g.88048 Transcript_33440/m.88048 type:complete len:371 (+) Transcript_33440:1349-2461(+)
MRQHSTVDGHGHHHAITRRCRPPLERARASRLSGPRIHRDHHHGACDGRLHRCLADDGCRLGVRLGRLDERLPREHRDLAVAERLSLACVPKHGRGDNDVAPVAAHGNDRAAARHDALHQDVESVRPRLNRLARGKRFALDEDREILKEGLLARCEPPDGFEDRLGDEVAHVASQLARERAVDQTVVRPPLEHLLRAPEVVAHLHAAVLRHVLIPHHEIQSVERLPEVDLVGITGRHDLHDDTLDRREHERAREHRRDEDQVLERVGGHVERRRAHNVQHRHEPSCDPEREGLRFVIGSEIADAHRAARPILHPLDVLDAGAAQQSHLLDLTVRQTRGSADRLCGLVGWVTACAGGVDGCLGDEGIEKLV